MTPSRPLVPPLLPGAILFLPGERMIAHRQAQYTTICAKIYGLRKKVEKSLALRGKCGIVGSMSEQLRTTKEAAEALKVTPATIRAWAKSGLIDVRFMPSGRMRIPQSAIDKIKEPKEA